MYDFQAEEIAIASTMIVDAESMFCLHSDETVCQLVALWFEYKCVALCVVELPHLQEHYGNCAIGRKLV